MPMSDSAKAGRRRRAIDQLLDRAELGERDHRIDLGQRAAYGGGQRRRGHRRAEDVGEPTGGGTLRRLRSDRNVDHTQEVVGTDAALHVSGDPHDREPVAVHPHSPPDRVRAGEVRLRGGLAQDRDAQLARDVAAGEPTAANRDVHCTEVAGARDAHARDRRDRPFGRGPALRLERLAPAHVAGQRQARTDHGCSGDARQGLEALQHAVVERDHRGAVVVPGARQPDLERQPLARAKAEVDRTQLAERPEEQAGAHEQHQREGHLRRHQHLAPVHTTPSGRHATGAVLERCRQVLRLPQRRQQAQQDGPEHRDGDRDAENDRVHPHFLEPWDVDRRARPEQPDTRRGARDPDHPGREGDQQRLGHESARDLAAVRAERLPDRCLALRLLRPHQVQVRDVAERDQQHESDRP